MSKDYRNTSNYADNFAQGAGCMMTLAKVALVGLVLALTACVPNIAYSNIYRAEQGLEALSEAPRLNQEAEQYARAFAATGKVDGTIFDDNKVVLIGKAAGYTELQDQWMNTDYHRDQILSSRYTRVGAGYVEKGGLIYGVLVLE